MGGHYFRRFPCPRVPQSRPSALAGDCSLFRPGRCWPDPASAGRPCSPGPRARRVSCHAFRRAPCRRVPLL
eukprot:3950-Alexandrium_andersonii.AAC.1